jgi:hypothetical protein
MQAGFSFFSPFRAGVMASTIRSVRTGLFKLFQSRNQCCALFEGSFRGVAGPAEKEKRTGLSTGPSSNQGR